MDLTALTAISPIDGRYRVQLAELANFFSEYALIRYRVLVEVEYFISLAGVIPGLKSFLSDDNNVTKLRQLYDVANFTVVEAEKVKAIEKVTNHDVKAVEYYLKEKFDAFCWQEYKEWIHFGLTSQDINNTAIPLSLKDALAFLLQPLNGLISTLTDYGNKWVTIPMLARTHGQPATPTRVGKELLVFVDRLQQQHRQLLAVPHSAKFGGATGQFNAHVVAFPDTNWVAFGDRFVSGLGLERERFTTQISHYDNIASLSDALARINTILIDLARDMWMYIMLEYFKQRVVANEVGSSAMPHKVNPIDFENAEGNLGVANALLNHFSAKLPISRLQRDLSDSTVLRNLGVPLSHTLLAFKSLQKGLGKISLNEEKIKQDLLDNFIVISEAIQTILRREGFEKPYEAVKALTRTGEHVTQQSFHDWVESLSVSIAIKAELKAISPFSFVGQVPSV